MLHAGLAFESSFNSFKSLAFFRLRKKLGINPIVAIRLPVTTNMKKYGDLSIMS